MTLSTYDDYIINPLTVLKPDTDIHYSREGQGLFGTSKTVAH